MRPRRWQDGHSHISTARTNPVLGSQYKLSPSFNASAHTARGLARTQRAQCTQCTKTHSGYLAQENAHRIAGRDAEKGTCVYLCAWRRGSSIAGRNSASRDKLSHGGRWHTHRWKIGEHGCATGACPCRSTFGTTCSLPPGTTCPAQLAGSPLPGQ